MVEPLEAEEQELGVRHGEEESFRRRRRSRGETFEVRLGGRRAGDFSSHENSPGRLGQICPVRQGDEWSRPSRLELVLLETREDDGRLPVFVKGPLEEEELLPSIRSRKG